MSDHLITRFIDHLRVDRNLSHNTVSAYLYDLQDLERHLAGRPAAGLSELDAMRYLGSLHARGLKDSTINRRRSALKSLTAWAADTGAMASDPLRHLPQSRSDHPIPRDIHPEDARRLVASVTSSGPLEARDAAILELLYGSGLRASELVGLTMDRVDTARMLVRVMGKGSRERLVPIGRPAAHAVDAYLRQRPETRHLVLFVNQRGGPLTRMGLWKIVRARGAAVGLHGLHPHRLRHACASHLLESGADLRAVQELLGHASLDSTQIYTRVRPGWLSLQHRTFHPRG